MRSHSITNTKPSAEQLRIQDWEAQPRIPFSDPTKPTQLFYQNVHARTAQQRASRRGWPATLNSDRCASQERGTEQMVWLTFSCP
jgi:hypothetical protein